MKLKKYFTFVMLVHTMFISSLSVAEDSKLLPSAQQDCRYIIAPAATSRVYSFSEDKPDFYSIRVEISREFNKAESEFHRGFIKNSCDQIEVSLNEHNPGWTVLPSNEFLLDKNTNSLTLKRVAKAGQLIRIYYVLARPQISVPNISDQALPAQSGL